MGYSSDDNYNKAIVKSKVLHRKTRTYKIRRLVFILKVKAHLPWPAQKEKGNYYLWRSL